MRWTKQPFVTAAGLTLLASIAVTTPALAQKPNGSAGTGGAAGYSPPMDEPYGGAAPMNVPPPMDDAMGAPAPEPMNAPPVEEEKRDESTPAPTDAAKDQ
jgi:hypothetical protein